MPGYNLKFTAGLLVVAIFSSLSIAVAEEIYSCVEIDKPGYYILGQDIYTDSLYCINITSSDVVLDGKGHTIRFTGGAPLSSNFFAPCAIYIKKPSEKLENVTIRNLGIIQWNTSIYADSVKNSSFDSNILRGFVAGIFLNSSSNISITNSTVTDSRGGIILFNSYYNTLKNNWIINAYYGLGFESSLNNTILDTTIERSDYGICFSNSKLNTISGCQINDNEFGISLVNSGKTRLLNNTLIRNGLLLVDSFSNTVVNNTVNGRPLVYLENITGHNVEKAGQLIAINSNNIIIRGQNLSHTNVGIEFYNVSNVIVQDNIFANNNLNGIVGFYLENVTFVNNTVLNCGIEGLSVDKASNLSIIRNTVKGNLKGVLVMDSSGVTVTGNRIQNNTLGLDVEDSKSCLIYGNYLNNINNTFILNSTIIWNTTFGNYWADPDGNGFSQVCSDGNSDGICDQPYQIDASNIDYLPLAIPLFKPGDIDGDGDVDFNDLIATLNLILAHNYHVAGDIDEDGNVDFNDLIGVLNIILTFD